MNKIVRFTPYQGYILVKTQDTQSETILTADKAGSQSTRGEVVVVGAPMLHVSGGYIEAKLNTGDTIIFSPYRADKIYLDDVEHLIIPFESIRGTLSEK
jgi:co-chaperonin GroES (HSP10)